MKHFNTFFVAIIGIHIKRDLVYHLVNKKVSKHMDDILQAFYLIIDSWVHVWTHITHI